MKFKWRSSVAHHKRTRHPESRLSPSALAVANCSKNKNVERKPENVEAKNVEPCSIGWPRTMSREDELDFDERSQSYLSIDLHSYGIPLGCVIGSPLCAGGQNLGSEMVHGFNFDGSFRKLKENCVNDGLDCLRKVSALVEDSALDALFADVKYPSCFFLQ